MTALFSGILTCVLIALLAWACGCFVLRFWTPGRRVGRTLKFAQTALTALKSKGPMLDLDQLRSEVMVSEALQRCWDEYRYTLHSQSQANAMGALEVSRWRATATANGFFTEQALVDVPLHSEFYKHLPGILTGIGIIGTFAGLILGLQAFGQIDLGDADRARRGLGDLLATVGHAFIVSGAAITIAMGMTFIEKYIVNGIHTQIESLCGLIDSSFNAGAGEEYLQRLVEAAETSATQATQMKESLVTDLKQVLTELTAQQIATMTSTSTQLGYAITTSLNDGLKEPLARISEAVKTVSSSQGEAVNKLMADVLSSFTAQMENMFGGQMRGMGEMLTQTANTIQLASQRFEQLVGHVQEAGASATQAMASRMDEALTQMQSRQKAANEQMTAFVEQMRQNAIKGQSESAEQTQSMMKNLGESTGALVKTMQDQATAAQLDHSSRQAELSASSAGLLTQQGDHITRLAETVARTEVSMRDTIERISSATDSHLERLGAGAERLLGASNSLSANLDLMKSSSDGLGDTADKLNAASRVLTEALTATQLALSDHKSVRDDLAAMVTALRATIAASSGEATLTGELVNGFQQAGQRMTDAQTATIDRQNAANDQMGMFFKQMQQDAIKGQSEVAELTTTMLTTVSQSTRALVKDMQDQARNAQLDQSTVQTEMANQMRTVVQQSKDSMVAGQSEFSAAAAAMLNDLAVATASSVRALQDQSSAAQQEQEARQAALGANTAELLARQSDHISRLVDTVTRTDESMRKTIDSIKTATDGHLDRMGVGAQRLLGASDSLSTNLGLMKVSSDGLSGTADQLTSASGTLTHALTATQVALSDHKTVRDALVTMVAELRATIEIANREAGLTSDLVNGLQQASRRLTDAQVATVTNLKDATDAIGDAHGVFAKRVEDTLREGNSAFHTELARATGYLQGAIQDLGDVLATRPVPA